MTKQIIMPTKLQKKIKFKQFQFIENSGAVLCLDEEGQLWYGEGKSSPGEMEWTKVQMPTVEQQPQAQQLDVEVE